MLRNAERFLEKHGRYLPGLALAMLVCMACIGSHTVKEGQDNYFATSLEACYELASGEASRFAVALDAREAAFVRPVAAGCGDQPAGARKNGPGCCFYTDVSVGPDLWGLTPYYGKDSVVVVERR